MEGMLTRRDFLRVAGCTALGMAAGCAKNPVTGESQLMLVSEEQEIALDKQQSPHQFSADYGPVTDAALNRYVTSVGMDMARRTHRPNMPYSFRALNATYVNAYAFPGGSIGVTRAILLDLDNEAELAALLGHELGHVNARHTASRVSTAQLASLAVGVGTAAASSAGLGSMAAGLGQIGMGALLAHYSRDDERQADSLGVEYMTRADYNPDGMVGLMDMLNEQHQSHASALEVMFATHPMSSERLAAARRAAAKFPDSREFRILRERYLDNTAGVRKQAVAIEAMQDGEKSMRSKAYARAEEHFQAALKKAPRDYAALLMMAKCQLAMNENTKAVRFSQRAREAYPAEPQAMQVAGLAMVRSGRYSEGLAEFAEYEKRLPGNPYTVFFKGLCREKMGDRDQAAREYYRFLQDVRSGDEARHAYGRLVQWGYIKS
ncbi:M48 family metalloprotease [Pseudodesulfovibrio senegalensis]|jgi:predicted Zn-dependent protease|uniref:M48 family metalloprotease n=1 Tax=Pseudodesulfovibrio senegalensis TaxID=1721087 RepID=A0A6N6N4H7_9BACT|nr:M48 family metalloprotease [Pseudodesulfovibrio senegalensis]KAB1443062.1 M48 family metalloprotease [Pseudodesulfovibrio senegalensis]